MKRISAFLIAAAVLSVPLGATGWQSAQAQEAKKEKPSKPKTRRSEVLGKAAFQRIEEAQNLMAEEKYDEAFVSLQAIIDSERFKPYEKAVAIQTMGFIYAAKGDYENTMATFERAIATGSLPPRVVNELTYNLAKLNLAGDQPKKALTLINKWLAAFDGEPPADAFGLKAQIHLVLGDLPQSILRAHHRLELGPPGLELLPALHLLALGGLLELGIDARPFALVQ